MDPRPDPRWNPTVAEGLAELAAQLPGATMGKMFGHPAMYVAGKLSACAFGDGVGVKLPADTVQALLCEPGLSAFTPYGKAPMREWLHVQATSATEVRAYRTLFEESAAMLLATLSGH
jgi:hypothetical protein